MSSSLVTLLQAMIGQKCKGNSEYKLIFQVIFFLEERLKNAMARGNLKSSQ